MNWKETATRNVLRLKDVINVGQFAQQLCELPQTHTLGIPDANLKDLAKQLEQAERQRQRLEKGEFRIAVVGLEKAGKSTFVNAWLGCDLLPAKSRRCTFTTTQIFSVTDVQQRLETQPKTNAQFQKLLNELQTAVGGPDETRAKNAKQDLDTIRRNEANLNEILTEGERTKPFSNLNEIKDDLRKYVADERYAHAMQEVRLYTCRLAEAEGIVFYDVPGLDSGLAKHIEESQSMLHDCDAVILIQRYPDLRGAEQDLIKFAREGDQHIRLEDKLFVFFGRIDTFATPEAFQTDFTHVKKAWREEANLSPVRIVAGSAGAHLVLHGMAGIEALKDIGDLKKITADLKRVNSKDFANDDELKQFTGIDNLKNIINNYLNTERVTIIERRCNGLYEEIMRYSDEIFTMVRKHYSENPDEARRSLDDKRKLKFDEWWSVRKDKLRADFNQYYEKELLPNFKSSTLKDFNQSYQEIISEGMKNLPSRSAEIRDTKFFSSQEHGFAPDLANQEWRKALYNDVRSLVGEIATQLAMKLDNDNQKVVGFLSKQLWGSTMVSIFMIGDEKNFQDRIQQSFKVLFLRFARPIVEALIRAPVGSQTRMNIVRDSGVDIEILDYYYPDDGEEIYRELKLYLKDGIKLISDQDTINKAFDGKPVKTDKIRSKLNSIIATINTKSVDSVLQQQVIEEVEADLLALEYYLLHSLFDAAGFNAFCLQELENLRDKFLECDRKDQWGYVARKEWSDGNTVNPYMLKELPAELSPQELNTEVSDRLRQLGIVLRKAHSSI